MPIEVFDLINSLDLERFRTLIIHATPEKGPALSKFCITICSRVNGKYLDLLDFFIQHPELSEIIDSFDPEKFYLFLKEQSLGHSLVIIDRADFLLDTWRKAEHKDFFRMVDKQWDGYKDGMNAKLIFSLQTSQEIEELRIIDSQSRSRVIQLTEFNDIG